MKYCFAFILGLLLFGCSSQKETSSSIGSAVAPGPSVILPDTLTQAELIEADDDSSSFDTDSTYDAVISEYLEAARGHYLAALDAREKFDSTKCVAEFESAIADLNELASFPGIDSSSDFSDLSRTVLEDYEKYIALIDSLGPQTSIFALREKLIQLSDTKGGAEQDTPKKIITSTTIPLVINGHVEEDIDFLRNRFKSHFETWLTRGSMYFPVVKSIFKKEGVPEELAYLSFIESGVNPVAQSWAKAVGMWQFIKGTGKMYGLRSNFWYDERKDFIKASHAAARHFKDLHNEFGDWYLALAAYNSGPGRVYRAMRKSGETDFWKLRPFLPKETRNYVPLYIAATVMGLDPKAYGFEFEQVDPIEYDEVTIADCVDLSVVAKCAATDVATIKRLNPSILRWCTPPGINELTLRVPKGNGSGFDEKYAAVPDDQKRNEVYHKVHRKETLASIARKYGISASLLADANKLSPKKRLTVGTILMIPVPSATRVSASEFASDDAPRKSARARNKVEQIEGRTGKDKVVYRIKRRDTLAEIARKYGVRVSDLRVWNDIPYGTKIKSGAKLTIWTPSAFANAKKSAPVVQGDLVVLPELSAKNTLEPSSSNIVVVKSGDNLKKVARRSGVTIAQLKDWNHLKSDVIKKGQKLHIGVADGRQAPTKGAKTSLTASSRKDSAKSSQNPTTYRVKKGDTLSTIASLFGVSIGDLKQWNNIHGHKIKVGQEIRINS